MSMSRQQCRVWKCKSAGCSKSYRCLRSRSRQSFSLLSAIQPCTQCPLCAALLHLSALQLNSEQGKNEFFKNKVIVSDFNGTIAPGQYAFPFQYQLPQGIPGVFEYHEKYGRLGCKVEAAIRYKLKATLDVGGFFMKDLKAKIHAVVHERKDPSIKPAYGENTSTVRLLGCIPKGKATLKAWFNNVSYTMGEVAYVKADISNDSKRDIGSMNTVLMREIIIRGRGFNNRHTIKGEVLKNKYPGVKALEKSEQDLPLQLNVAQPTANGNLISCRYWLDIECDISFAPDIEVHMPVEIFAPQPEVSGVILEGWEGALPWQA
uniref:Arrestin C-terminal-like domain-containing protein n=1 Tax=Palpitomonas bilix TaxID=652834 RepID=A0A7S3GJ85_9EUKA|mmetsp:Transcript_5822/g.13757  ORF Transcript_5822/g.13757 Transcript_5822/m.13757 type:complete len:319 (+) Transcript_5822:733-1689(+)